MAGPVHRNPATPPPHRARLLRSAGSAGIALVMAIATAGCSSGSANRIQPLTVFAAASLTSAFQELAAEFKRQNPGTEVRLNFGGSATLATQLQGGAPADVFASADEQNMKKVSDAGLVGGTPQLMVRNELAILVPPGNPKKVATLRDLTRSGLVVALCAPSVPAGRYGREAFAKAGLTAPRGSGELDVKQVVSRVALGEADAGIGYVTDARAAAGKVRAVAIPREQNVVARYPIAALKDAPAARYGRKFVALTLSAPGQAVFAGHGFRGPR